MAIQRCVMLASIRFNASLLHSAGPSFGTPTRLSNCFRAFTHHSSQTHNKVSSAGDSFSQPPFGLNFPFTSPLSSAPFSPTAAAAAATTAIHNIHTIHLNSIEALFLQHRHYLGPVCMEQIVRRVMESMPPKTGSTNQQIQSPAHPRQGATILSNILSHQPPLNVRTITTIIHFFQHHQITPMPIQQLLAALFLLPVSQQKEIGLHAAGDILCSISKIFPIPIPEPVTDESSDAVVIPANPITPAAAFNKACTAFCNRLMYATTKQLNNSVCSIPAHPLPSNKTHDQSDSLFLSPHNLSAICHGAAQLKIKSPEFWEAAAAAVSRGGLHGAKFKLFGDVVSSFAAAEHNSRHLAQVCSAISTLVEGASTTSQTPQSCMHLLSAFGQAHYRHAPLLDRVLSLMIVDCISLDAHNVSRVLRACAHVSHNNQQVRLLLKKVTSSPTWERHFTAQMPHRFAANILWSLSVLDLLPEHPVLVSQLLLAFGNITSPTQLRAHTAQQLAQVHASLGRLGMGTGGLPSRALLADAVAADSNGNETMGSRMQSEVVQRLEKLIGTHGILTVQEEAKLLDGLLSVDVLVTLEGGRRVAVEVDGFFHFLMSNKSQVNGSTQWRNNMLVLAVGGQENVICLRRSKGGWLNYITGKSVGGDPEQFLLEEILSGGVQQAIEV